MISKAPSYVTLSRHQIYYVQLRVPKHIRHNTHLKQQLIRKSLETRHKGTAIRLARKVVVRMGDIYDELIVISNRINSVRMWREHFTKDKGRRHADQWAQDRLCHELDRLGCKAIYIREFFDLLTDEEEELVAYGDDFLIAKARRILTDNPVAVSDECLNGTIPVSTAIPTGTPQTAQPLSADHIAKAVSKKLMQDQENKRSEGKRTPLLSDLRGEFIQGKVDGQASASYLTELTDRTSWFIDALTYFNQGTAPKTHEITPIMLKSFAALVKKLPSHINKRGTLKHLSREDQIAYLIERTGKQLQDEDFELLKNRTKNFYYDYALALLNHGEENACLFSENLDKEIHLKKLKEDKDSDNRSAFTKQELKLLFESEQYRHAKLSKASYYWVPLISLYSGATMAEILQLYVSDIRYDKEEKVWYFNYKIEDEAKAAGDQQMKNSKSRYRRVPIHKTLKDLQFLAFVKGREEKGFKKLFPEERRYKNGKFKNFSVWFNVRFKSKFNIKRANGERKDFHNLRHCVATNLVGNGYDIGIANSIMGHASKNRNETEMTYAEGLFLSKQNEIIQKIDYDINHKYPKRFVDRLGYDPSQHK